MSKKSKPEASFMLLVTALGRDRGETIVTAEPGEIAFLESFKYAIRTDAPIEVPAPDEQTPVVVAVPQVDEVAVEVAVASEADAQDGDQLLDQV